MLEHISGLRDNLQKYLETKMSYYGMLAFERAVRLLSLFMGQVVVMLATLLGLLFLSAALSIYLGELLGSHVYGLLIVGGFFLILALMFFSARRKVFSRWAIKTLMGVFFTDDDADTKHKGG